MKNKRKVKGAKASKNFGTKAITKKTVTAKTRTGGATVVGNMLKVPASLQKCLIAKAAADTNFKGNNWQRYALTTLKNFAAIEKAKA